MEALHNEIKVTIFEDFIKRFYIISGKFVMEQHISFKRKNTVQSDKANDKMVKFGRFMYWLYYMKYYQTSLM